MKMPIRAIDVINKVSPHARAEYVSAFDNGDALLQANSINNPLRLAHFLAQCLHETGGLTITWESGNYSAERLMQIFGVGHHSAAVTASEAQRLAHDGPAIFERVYGLGNPKKARELGNTSPGDGFKYRGGGIMQTTGRANYCRMGIKCGVDFETHPELVLSAEHALKPAMAEWTEGHLNDAADRDDITTITKRINGGLNGLDDRKTWFRKVRALIDAVSFDPTATTPPDQGRSAVHDAKWVQHALNVLNFGPLVEDGNSGPRTRDAVLAFQKSHGLIADGVAGPKTNAALEDDMKGLA